MYKPVPSFGPAREREAALRGWQTLGSLAVLFLIPLVGALLGGSSGSSIGAMVAVFLLFAISQEDEKKIIPILPVMWDREIDSELS